LASATPKEIALTDWTDQTARARAWFESLRDRICGAFEAIEAEAGSDARFSYRPWAREHDGEPVENGGAACRA
jgi:coproporphyrinogen III oxidase